MTEQQPPLVDEPDETVDHGLPVDEHEEEVSVGGQRVRRRGVYLLPNLLTTGALFSGFYAIVSAMNGHFESAAIAIFVAMFFDGMDGRVARMTNTQSAFGVQYDSLSDMVSFGVAPALVMFSWALSALGKLGWGAAFIYVAGAALRLAFFNTQVGKADSGYFSGLASPAAAMVLAALVWSSVDMGFYGDELPAVVALIALVLTTLVGLLMVTNIPYQSFKKFDLHKRVPFVFILLLVVLVGVITVDPPRFLLLIGLAYALSGPLQRLLTRRQKTDPQRNSASNLHE